jgi:hypothetical protein
LKCCIIIKLWMEFLALELLLLLLLHLPFVPHIALKHRSCHLALSWRPMPQVWLLLLSSRVLLLLSGAYACLLRLLRVYAACVSRSMLPLLLVPQQRVLLLLLLLLLPPCDDVNVFFGVFAEHQLQYQHGLLRQPCCTAAWIRLQHRLIAQYGTLLASHPLVQLCGGAAAMSGINVRVMFGRKEGVLHRQTSMLPAQ